MIEVNVDLKNYTGAVISTGMTFGSIFVLAAQATGYNHVVFIVPLVGVASVCYYVWREVRKHVGTQAQE